MTIMVAAMDRLDALMAEPELVDNGMQTLADDARFEIEFQNVRFAYDDENVLDGINFAVEKGETCALVGPSGSGKSTIASMLARFWDVTSGRVLVRGKDIREVPLAELMNSVSMVFQNVYLFEDTIYNNILLGRQSATREEVYEAAKKARCYDFIMDLPYGFDTLVGEAGATLSGGEAQRISIARCILKDAPIVILDEATASIDPDNEIAIQGAIDELCQGKTLLVIAHRLNTVRDASRILVIENGAIAERGTHAELMELGGRYRRMQIMQQRAISWTSSNGEREGEAS